MTILADHVVALILELAKEQGGLSFFSNDLPVLLKDRWGLDIPKSLSDAALKRLTRLGGAEKLESPLTGDLYKVSRDGALGWFHPDSEPTEHTDRDYDRRWDEAQTSFSIIRTYYHGGQTWLDRAIQALKEINLHEEEAGLLENLRFAPAGDRVVSFDHNSEQATEVIEILEEVAEQVRGDNEGRLVAQNEKPRILEQFESAKRLLRVGRVSVKAIYTLLLPALTYLATKFADESIGELASALIKALANLVGVPL